MVKVSVAVFGLVAAVAGSTAVAVHHLDQTEIKRVEDKAAMNIARVEGERKSEVARVEGERRLSEDRLRAEVERYKYDLRLTQTEDFKPYQAAILENKIKRGGAGGPQD
jgi:hypothetical protein